MNVRLPLFSRILLWFFLNLALLATGFYLLVRAQFVFDRDFILTASAADRIQALGNRIAAEMQTNPPTEWDAIINDYNSAYSINCYVFDQQGRPLVGDAKQLPPEVHDRLGRRPPPPRGRPPRLDPNPEFGLDDGPPPLPQRPSPDSGPANQPTSHMLLRAGNPAKYWAFVRVNLKLPDRPQLDHASIAIASDSFSGGGLFLDLRPWLIAIFGAVIFSALFWLPFVRGITKSVAQMTAATQRISEGHFDVRIHATRGDELGTLGRTINSMAGRLDGFVTGQKRFLGDIAHELCSPLARLRVALGILEERVDEQQRPDVARANEKADEIANLVNELLSFSKAALGARQVNLQPTALRDAVAAAVSKEDTENVRINVNVTPDIRVLAEPELLKRALANLLRNAIRYAGTAGPITIDSEVCDGAVMVSVSDCGPGIPESELQRIFDPFYRLDPSRDRQTGGVGLGLAIVKTCVEACQGTVSAKNRQPTGLQVVIALACATPS